MGLYFTRRAKVGKTINFSLDVSEDYPTLTGATVVEDSGLVTVGTVDFSSTPGFISVPIIGLTAGETELHFNWTTATESDCYTARLIVESC